MNRREFLRSVFAALSFLLLPWKTQEKRKKEETNLDGQVSSAIWTTALTDEEIAALFRGLSPLLIQPDRLVGYRIIGEKSSQLGWMPRLP